MKLIERAFQIAEKELGVKEISGVKDNPRIIEYLKSVDFNDEIVLHDEIPYCSAFVNWCLQKAGGKGTRSPLALSFLGWGRESDGKYGDIVVLRRGSSAWQGHVGFLIEKGLTYVTVLGGNQDNQVCIRKYLRLSVRGYRTSFS